MKRHLCISTFFALVLIPDWSAACGPRGGMSGYGGGYYAPVCPEPVYYAVQPVYAPPVYCQPVYVQPCIPVMPPVYQPPRVEQSKPKSSALPAPSRPIARPTPTPAPVKPPEANPVRPAAAIESATPPAKPNPVPSAPTPDPKRGPDVPRNPTPARPPTVEPSKPEVKLPEPKLPDLELPKIGAPKLPSLDLPKEPGAGQKAGESGLPPLTLPGAGPEPKRPSLDSGGGNAVPSAAPAPDALIPSPNIPSLKEQHTLPPLTLPPDSPVSPSPMSPKGVEVKSSPISGVARGLKVSVFPASGATPTNGLRKVGFYNHTKRDLALTIEGRPVNLPAMSYLYAQLPPTFTWKCAEKPAAKESIPADATGLDVLIRE
jgi:hypothetical protein